MGFEKLQAQNIPDVYAKAGKGTPELIMRYEKK